MTNVTILPGLLDEHTEIFAHNQKAFAIHKGKTIDFFDLPKEYQEAIWSDILQEEGVFQVLEMNGFITKKSKLAKVAICRYGRLDNQADISQDYQLSHEHYDCGIRESCPMEGIVCKSVTYNGHVLSPFELKLLSLLATEDTTPVVAEKMKVSINTLDTRKKILFEKFGVLSRPRLVALAFFANLINPSLCFDKPV